MTEKFIVDLYIRVSTDHQVNEGNSLEEQEKELKIYCEFRKFEIRNIYIEKGKSGGNTNRPEYQKLLTDVREKKINGVVVKKIDRFSRSLLDFEAFMKLSQEKDVEFISIKDSFDTTTALGKAMLRIALIFAQLEREQTSERLMDVFEYRASQGKYNGGTRPFGYTTANKELVPYPKEKQIVELIFEHFLKTRSISETSRFLNSSGYRNRLGQLWDKRLITKIIINPVYKGIIRWNNKFHRGLHQPIITPTIFDEAQLLFKKRAKLKENSKTKAVLQALLFCGYCGSPMTPSFAYNKNRMKYYYYRCTSMNSVEKRTAMCIYKYVSYKIIEARFMKIFLELTEEQHFKPIELKIMQHNKTIEKQQEAVKYQIEALETQLKETKLKKEKYLDSLIASQFNSNERQLINNKIQELDLEEKHLKSQLYASQFEQTQIIETLIRITDFKQTLIYFKTNHETLSHNQTREFLLNNITEITYYPEKLGIQFKILPWKLDFAT